MSRGQIERWTFNDEIDNHGVLAGCSADVAQQRFSFSIDDVTDQGLAQLLAQTPQLSRNPDCSQGPSAAWVSFDATGNTATNIVRLFH